MSETFFRVGNYDLATTLSSGQAFRWRPKGDGWEGVIGRVPLLLRQDGEGIFARAGVKVKDWGEVRHYLQVDVDLDAIVASFPKDGPMECALAACPGLRLLRQEPWECLASFILSSTKQIVQIQQIVEALCNCYGEALPGAQAFPTAARLAALEEKNLRDCKMGFRAPYLLKTARIIASGELDLESLHGMPTGKAREALCELPGVGEKIANCVLLFAYGFQDAFPVDVWVQKAIRELYFPKRKPTAKRLKKFVETYFGANAGYAQQYLFHYMRTRDEQDD